MLTQARARIAIAIGLLLAACAPATTLRQPPQTVRIEGGGPSANPQTPPSDEQRIVVPEGLLALGVKTTTSIEGRRREATEFEYAHRNGLPTLAGTTLRVPAGLRLGARFKTLSDEAVAWSNANGVYLEASCDEPLPRGLQWLLCTDGDDASWRALAHQSKIRGLIFEGVSPSGAGMARLAALHDLEELQLQFVDAKPHELGVLGLLTQLKVLHVTGSNIDDVTLAHLSSLTHLEVLNLPLPQITGSGFDHLSVMPNVELLNVWGAPLNASAVERIVEKFPNLRSLLVSMDDAGARHLHELTALEELDVTGTDITPVGLASIATLPALERLCLGYMALRGDDLQALAGARSLTALELRNNPLTGADLRFITKLRKLRVLGLLETGVGEEALRSIGKLGALEELVLDSAAPFSSTHLRGLRSLRVLSLRLVELDADASRALGSLTQIGALNLYGTNVHNGDLAHFTRLHKLRRLDLGGTDVSDAGLPHLANLGLTKLRLDDNRMITDAGMMHVKRVHGLQHLYLTDTAVGDLGVEEVASLPALQSLWLTGTKVTNASVEHLVHAPQLRVLALKGTRIRRADLPANLDLAVLRVD